MRLAQTGSGGQSQGRARAGEFGSAAPPSSQDPGARFRARRRAVRKARSSRWRRRSTRAKSVSIDARGMICMPGFIDTHWHLWTSVLRPVIRIDNPKLGYQPATNRLGRLYTPEDSYRAVRLGLAEGLAAGATTVHNWAHNIRSPAHADAELRAMRDMGMRGRLAYGTPRAFPTSDEDSRAWRRIRASGCQRGHAHADLRRNVGDRTNPLAHISVETAARNGRRALARAAITCTPRGQFRSSCGGVRPGGPTCSRPPADNQTEERQFGGSAE